MQLYWDIVIVTVVLLTVLLALSMLVRLGVKEEAISSHPLPVDKIRDGSILLVSYNSTIGHVVKYFTGSRFTHVVLCVTIDGVLSTVEMAHYHDQEGLCILPLDQFLDRNKKKEVVVRNYIGSFPTGKVLACVERLRHVAFETRLIAWLRAVRKVPWYEREADRYYCSQLIAHLLQDSDILAKEYLPQCYQPRFFAHERIEGYAAAAPLERSRET
jgi:hypothetical protein